MAAASAVNGLPLVHGGAAASWPLAVADRYQPLRKLGQGFYGEVYAAWDTKGGRLVAVKRLSGRTDDQFVATGLREFEQEVTSLAACRGHPSVVTLLAMFNGSHQGDGDRFIVTELGGQMNLRRYIQLRRREGRPFREGEVRHAMAQLLSGVRCAHGAGVLHRDIVPENVLVDEKKKKKNRYKICGFGASEPAAALTERDGSAMLATSSPYRAPELFLGSKDYDGRIDTWGLGCIMAELLAGTGMPFFGARLDAEVFQNILNLVGAQGIGEWSGLQRLATPDLAGKLREQGCLGTSRLREVFTEETLSHAGFDVLSGLLQANPERRLTAAAALKMPWFRRCNFSACFAL